MIPHPFQLTTAEESQRLDSRTIDEFGIDGYTLMEIAGSKMAENLLPDLDVKSHVLILCGKGNNGGDGLVVARYLIQHQHPVTVTFISGTDDLSPDAHKNYQLLRKLNHNGEGAPELKIIDGWKPREFTGEEQFIVDAMLGTGLNSNLRGDYASAVKWLNAQQKPVFSVDIPTGLHSDSGKIMGHCVKASKTCTFGTRKLGCYLNEGPENSGDIVYCDLPFPNYLKSNHARFLMDESWIESQRPEKKPAARHKYEAGVLYIIAGSEGLTGAAIMAAKSAWAEGIGAVIIIAPRGIISVFEQTLPQIIKQPIGGRSDYHFKAAHLTEVNQIIETKPGPVLLGPGLGREKSTVNFVHKLLESCSRDLIIDADGLWALAQQDWGKKNNHDIVLTPHPGELGNLLNKKISDDYQRLKKTEIFCQEKKITLVAKGYPTIVCNPKKQSFLTGYNTRIFCRAGFGDILAGKIGAFMAKKYAPTDSCLHGLLEGYKKSRRVQNRYLEPLDLV